MRAFQQLPDGRGSLVCHDSVAPADSSTAGTLGPHLLGVP
jgi:hypothetical protein